MKGGFFGLRENFAKFHIDMAEILGSLNAVTLQSHTDAKERAAVVRKRKSSKDPDSLKNVGIYREIHTAVHVKAAQEGRTIQEMVNLVLAEKFGLDELVGMLLETAEAK